ncbi:protocatechuate 3,4-dioxygenase subunit beta [Flexivirga sp. ID2601S]|uniref:Protocatechuate 3,4-dioxygenase subunit beta n=1 Tax=Flexivirga aerilata TaxID=1656889 RepID=A0A849AFH1_9MICO|nr:protocatechuate 3,4-dioxygenase subunit beta [Flexivirga aerilata]NNG38326.1 protocatechuate 3,4-dioxygenase subunit beta [Flexivirga aerilata]
MLAPRSRLDSQSQISDEMAQRHETTRAPDGSLPDSTLLDFAPYRSSVLRHPTQPLQPVDPEAAELFAPCFGSTDVWAGESDLTTQHRGEPIGERMVVTGRILDSAGRPVRRQLVEIWQANSAGRYIHQNDQHPAPLDPNFSGIGRCLTDDDGGYRFTTIRPGPYPWRNHLNAWRPAHIHFSLFGTAFTQRLVTQMYFPNDPLLSLDPIAQAIPDDSARARLVASYDHGVTTHEWATGYRFDVILGGGSATPLESPEEHDA